MVRVMSVRTRDKIMMVKMCSVPDRTMVKTLLGGVDGDHNVGRGEGGNGASGALTC